MRQNDPLLRQWYAVLERKGFVDCETPSEERQYRRLKERLGQVTAPSTNHVEERLVAFLDGAHPGAAPDVPMSYEDALAAFYGRLEAYADDVSSRRERRILLTYAATGDGHGRVAEALGISVYRVRRVIERHTKLAGLTNPRRKLHG
jgi:hypothetical protein